MRRRASGGARASGVGQQPHESDQRTAGSFKQREDSVSQQVFGARTEKDRSPELPEHLDVEAFLASHVVDAISK